MANKAKDILGEQVKALRGMFSNQQQRDTAQAIETLIAENKKLRDQLDAVSGPIPGSRRTARALGATATVADHVRLNKLNARIWRFMADGLPHTLQEIADQCRCETQTASAQLRLFRRPEYGGHKVESKRMGGGNLWVYTVTANPAVVVE